MEQEEPIEPNPHITQSAKMQNASLVRDKLSKTLGNAFLLSANPDHPYLLAVPDLLIAINNRLLAIFLSNRYEDREPQKLLARLTLARLALSSNTICILGHEPTTGGLDLAPEMVAAFDEVVDVNKIHPLVSHLKKLSKQTKSDERVSIKLKETAYANMEVIYMESLKYINEHPEGFPDQIFEALNDQNELLPIEIKPWLGPEVSPYSFKSTTRDMRSWKETTLGRMPQLSPAAYTNRLAEFCKASFSLDYSLDNGVVYPLRSPRNILVVRTVLAPKDDPLKPLRAAAFAGWVIAKATTMIDVERIADYLASKIE